MPALNLGSDYTAGQLATAAIFNARFQAILDWANTTKLDHDNIQALGIITSLLADGAVTGPKLDPAILAALGISDGTNIRRGKSYISAAGTTTSATFTALSNGPDVVTGLVVPANALIRLSFSAIVHSATKPCEMAIFIGSNQLKVPVEAGGTPSLRTQAALIDTTSDSRLFSFPAGLVMQEAGVSSTVTTGETLAGLSDVSFSQSLDGAATAITIYMAGGYCLIRGLTPGTYDVSIQSRANGPLGTGGTLTAKNRELNVEVIS